MLTRIVLAAALVLGAAAVAQASSGRDENGGSHGGYHISPFGLWLGGRGIADLHFIVGFELKQIHRRRTQIRYSSCVLVRSPVGRITINDLPIPRIA